MSPTSAPVRLPEQVRPYRTTAEFDHHSLPQALRKNHSTKAGVWALIHVLEGRLRYCVPQWQLDVVLTPNAPGIVAPQVEHFVEPMGAVRLYVEFHAEPQNSPDTPHA